MKLILAMALVAGLTTTNAIARSQATACDSNINTSQVDCVLDDNSKYCDHLKVYQEDPVVDYDVSDEGKEQVTKTFFKKKGSQKINICIIGGEVASVSLGK